MIMKSLLIVGGTGFFGKSFIHAFIEGKLGRWRIGELVIASRNASAFAQHNPAYLLPNISYINLDIKVISEMPACDYVMHFAGSSDKASYEKNLGKEIRNIEKNMLSFVESIEKSAANPSHILFASSGAVYGPTDSQTFYEDDPVDNIDAFTSIKRHYARAKLISEKIFCQLEKKHRKVSIARCFSFVGPDLTLNTHFVAGNLIQNIVNKEPLKIRANTSVVRSYLHSDDLVAWLMEILLNGTAEGNIYNVGSDDSIEIHDLAKELAHRFGLPTEIAPYAAHDVDWYVPNVNRARSLGLDLQYSSLHAIIRTVDQIRRKSSGHGI